jgi:hypothetical protein
MKKSGSKGGQRERRKQARVAKTKAKQKKKSAGKTTLAAVPDLPALPDRRVMEGFMAGMLGGPGGGARRSRGHLPGRATE